MTPTYQARDLRQSIKEDGALKFFHKSIKQNTSLEKSPARRKESQSNHMFASILAYIKLEKLKVLNSINHFAMKAKIYINSVKAGLTD